MFAEESREFLIFDSGTRTKLEGSVRPGRLEQSLSPGHVDDRDVILTAARMVCAIHIHEGIFTRPNVKGIFAPILGPVFAKSDLLRIQPFLEIPSSSSWL